MNTAIQLKPRPPWANWPKGKHCNHPNTREVVTSPGWGAAWNAVETVCEQCGKVLSKRPYNGN